MEQLTGTMSSVPDSNNYENMNHKPQINGVELVGNKTSEELGLGGDYVTRGASFSSDRLICTPAARSRDILSIFTGSRRKS